MADLHGSAALDELTAMLAALEYDRVLQRLEQLDLATLSDAERGAALGIEAVAKDRLSGQDDYLPHFLDQVLEQTKPGWVFRHGTAAQLSALGEFSAAEKLLRQLSGQLPGDSGLQAELAAAVEQQGRAGDAEQIYSRILEADPRNEVAILGLVRCLSQQGHLDRAIDALNSFLVTAPDNVAGWAALGSVYAAGGSHDQAAQACDRALALGGELPAILYAQAANAWAAGDRRRAGEFAQRLEAAASGEWRSELATAMAVHLAGDGDQAAGAARRAFDAALALPDAAGQEEGLGEVFSFCARVPLLELARALTSILLAQGVLPESVLEALRVLRGESSPAARDFLVVVAGTAAVHAALATGDRHRTGEMPKPFFRVYRAHAVTPEAAAAEALEMENATGAREVRIEEVQERGEPGESLLGIYFRSGRVFYREEEAG